MPICCIVPGCTSGYKSNKEKVNFFPLPRNIDERKQWQEVIRRPDLKLEGRYYVCSHHFPDTSILWKKILFSPEGTVLGESPYNKPKLQTAVVPVFFPWTEKKPSMTIPFEKPTTQCEMNIDDAAKDQEKLREKHIDDTVQESKTMWQMPTENTKMFAKGSANYHKENVATNNLIFDDVMKGPITLPTSWTRNVHSVREESVVVFTITNYEKIGELYNEINSKSIFVSPSLSLLVKVNRVVVDICKFQLKNSISDLSSFQDILFAIDSLYVCHGAAIDMDGIYCRVISTDCYNIKRHNQCTFLSESIQCEFCHRVKRTILRSKQRKVSGQVCQNLSLQTMSLQQRSYVMKLKKNFLQTLKKNKQLLNDIKELKVTLADCYLKMTVINESTVLDALKNTAIPKNQQTVVSEILKASKRKLPNGHRYSEDWMILCLLLHIRSPSNYNFLRINNILPLPCSNTLKRTC